MNDLTNKIRQAQHAIVDLLVAWESSLAELYTTYAELFDDSADLWRALAAEETHHANTVRELHDVISAGNLLNNIGEFREERLAEELEQVKQALEVARRGRLTERNAISTAMSVETSVVDSQFFEIVTCDTPAFDRIAKIMRDESDNHVHKLRNRFEALYAA